MRRTAVLLTCLAVLTLAVSAGAVATVLTGAVTGAQPGETTLADEANLALAPFLLGLGMVTVALVSVQWRRRIRRIVAESDAMTGV